MPYTVQWRCVSEFSAFFDAAAAKWADRPALVVRHQNRMGYAELQAAVDKLAAGLLTLGLNPGDRIGIWSLFGGGSVALA